MAVVYHAQPGHLGTLILLSIVMLVLVHASSQLRSPLDRMSLNFGVAHKPYTPAEPKPKKPKSDKFRDLMAIAKYSGVGIVGMSGKIQGTVFLNNNVVRVWHKTKTVRDAATNLVKGIFSGISTAFRSLTAAQVLAWNGGAVDFKRKNALAEVKTLTGSQMYQRINNILISLGLAPITTPPGVGTLDAITRLAGVGDVSAQTVLATVTTFGGAVAIPATTYYKVYATPQFGVSKSKFSKSDYRYIGFFPATTAINPLDFSADYIAQFGAIRLNQRIGYAIQAIFYDSTNFTEGGKIYDDLVTVA